MELIEQLTDIAKGITKVKNKYIEEKLPINYLTIFTQSSSEYKRLVRKAREVAKAVDANNGLIFKFNEPMKFEESEIEYFRLRRPDEKRPEKGGGDFEVEDYDAFKEKYLPKYPKEMHEQEMEDYLVVELYERNNNFIVNFPDSPLAY
jgi:uncharacterized protein YllA (UPF0747 family)